MGTLIRSFQEVVFAVGKKTEAPQPLPALAAYLRKVKDDLRFTSDRSFAKHLGISPRSLKRLYDGIHVTSNILDRVADNLHLDRPTIYKMAGLFSEQLPSAYAELVVRVAPIWDEMTDELQDEVVAYAKMRLEQYQKKQKPRSN